MPAVKKSSRPKSFNSFMLYQKDRKLLTLLYRCGYCGITMLLFQVLQNPSFFDKLAEYTIDLVFLFTCKKIANHT